MLQLRPDMPPKKKKRIDTLSTWQNPHIGSLICGVRTSTVVKVKWKPVELPLPRKIVKQKQYRIPGGIAEISATTSPLNLPVGLCRRQTDFGE